MWNKPSVKVGDVFTNNQGSEFTVVEYTNANNLVVEFNDKHMYQCDASVGQIKRGIIKNKYFPSVCGVGYIGEGDFERDSQYYPNWTLAIKSGYIKRGDEFCDFQIYAEWRNSSKICGDSEIRYNFIVDSEGKYIPCLLPKRISKALSTGRHKGEYLKGVFKSNKTCNKPYSAKLRKKYKPHFLGTFDTQEEAHEAYVKAKEEYVKELALEYKEQLADDVFDALMEWKVDGE